MDAAGLAGATPDPDATGAPAAADPFRCCVSTAAEVPDCAPLRGEPLTEFVEGFALAPAPLSADCMPDPGVFGDPATPSAVRSGAPDASGVSDCAPTRCEPSPEFVDGFAPVAAPLSADAAPDPGAPGDVAPLSADAAPDLAFAVPAADIGPEADPGARPSPVFSAPVFAGAPPAATFATELAAPAAPGPALPRTVAGAPSASVRRPGAIVAPAICTEASGVEPEAIEGPDEDLRTKSASVRVALPAPRSPRFCAATRPSDTMSEATGPRIPRPACPKSAWPGAGAI